MLDPDKLSFTGSFPLPLRHGMTMGELAGLMNGQGLSADLHVVANDGLESEGLVRLNRVAMGESFAKHSQPR